jgi:hypothetical protein
MCLRLRSGRIQNYEMDILEVLEERMQVVEMETTTCVVSTQFTLTIKNVESVLKGTSVVLY